MGWHTNYEVEFNNHIDWDDDDVRRRLSDFAVQHLYLRDMEKPRLMLCVYSQNPVEEILNALKSMYHTSMCYRIYNTGEEWVIYT